ARAFDWQAATALASAQRYADAAHPDFELFRNALQRSGLGAPTRASLLFALGKAFDDIADPARATDYFRQGNAIVADIAPWSRKQWRRVVEARLNAKPGARARATKDESIPIFVLGVPRSGTTLVAEWLARHPDVVNRGELGWMPHVARELAQTGASDGAALDRAAATYLAHLRQDDASARWFIDKQPLNFLHIDLIATLFPQARIIYCERDARDTALSIWMQYFVGPENNFAYDFANIATVIHDCQRLMAKACAGHRVPIHRVRYEDAVHDADACQRELATWLELPDVEDWSQSPSASSIATASAWQARQPVHSGSIGRWRAYAPYLPELLKSFPGTSS
ncbi:MAG: sulfotransferase, partial [Rhodanobacteraceae bacterium]